MVGAAFRLGILQVTQCARNAPMAQDTSWPQVSSGTMVRGLCFMGAAGTIRPSSGTVPVRAQFDGDASLYGVEYNVLG